MTTSQFETLWLAISKLESQIARNPDLPEYYKTVCRDAFKVLKDIHPEAATCKWCNGTIYPHAMGMPIKK